jgi:hypothetical protein
MAVMNPASDNQRAQSAKSASCGAPPVAAGAVACAEWLTRVLDRQLALFARLDELSREQSSSVSSGDADTLLSILARRENVIRDIAELSERVSPVRSTWPDLSSVVPEAQRRELRTRMDAIDRAVRVINERDEADRRVMERERGAIAEELSSMGRVRGAVSAYSSPQGVNSPRYQDRTG